MCALYHCVIGITLEYLTSYISVQLLASQRPLTDVFRLASRETSLVLVTPKVTISWSKNQIFMPLFYVHIGQKPIFPVFHGQIWLKLHPTLLNRTSHFRHFSTECYSQPQRKLHWMKDTTLSYRKNTSEAFARLSLQSSKMATSKTNTGIIYNEIIYDPYKTEIHSIHLI